MKHGIVIKNSKIPQRLSIFINIYAITLWPFIIFKDEGNEQTIKHERIHIVQQAELFVVFFYLLYVTFWFLNLLKYRNFHAAYMNIPFEREAYEKEYEEDYLDNRKRFAWKDYIL